MLGEFTLCGFRVFWQRAIMDTDWGILHYALFVSFVTTILEMGQDNFYDVFSLY